VSPRGGVIGTAGHIDHGKTALVRALTGIDTDRLKEEKARGITIELGFAHLPLPSGRVVGVVDVPGHERFLRAMVAGAVGLDLVVLVVAADEGVMPQTREHLDVCRLLGVSRGVIALSKSDAASAELRTLAEADVRAAVVGTPLGEAPIIACSARTGEGLDALRRAIDEGLDAAPAADAWPAPPRGVDAVARLPIDRVFTMKGFGSVVTGTLWSGTIRVGDEVELLPGGARERVRGLQVHGGPVESATAGHRVAVNLPLPRETLARGDVLGHAGALEAGRIFDAQLDSLPTTRRALGRRSRVLLHAGTVQLEAVLRVLEGDRLEPGGRAFVEIEASAPLVLYPGDRFVLRGHSAQRGYGTTLGGGVVLRVLGARSKRGARTAPGLLGEHLAALRAGDVERGVALALARAGERGLDRIALARRVAASPRALDQASERLLGRRAAFRFDRSRQADVDAGALSALGGRVIAAVEAHHLAHPLEPGPPREALRAVVAEARLLHLVLEALLADGSLLAERDRVRRPAHDPGRAAGERGVDALAARVLEVLATAGLAPPRPADLTGTLAPAPTPAALQSALDALARQGRVTRVQGLYFEASAVATLRERLVAHLRAHGQIAPAAWKELVGASRKYSIPLAEHFDAERLTLRVGEVRKLRG
jgi:selenocysteine-specific elongation factor